MKLPNPFKAIESVFYALRALLWGYPDLLWGKDDSLATISTRVYKLSRPYSHFLFSSALCVLFIAFLANLSQFKVFAQPGDRLIEGVIMGVNGKGELQSLSKVNPLYPTLIQLERDISEIVYEPLIRYNQNRTVTPVLAQTITVIQEGSDYEFDLREGVFWHDSTAKQPRPFSIDDVIRTLEIVSQIDTPDGLDISYVQAIKQMAWEKVGPNAIRICTTTPELQQTLTPDLQNKKCSGVEGDKPILANFLELVGFKIMPAHLTQDINARNIFLPDPPINKRPVGTGAYKFDTVAPNSITLVRNESYHGKIPQIKYLEFRLFKDKATALNALQNSEIHSLGSTSTEFYRDILQYPQVVANKSPVLVNQYWAVYFNLRKDLEDRPLGPAFFQDELVRRGISAGIDRNRIISTLLGNGEEAYGPIYSGNDFFNPDAGWYRFNRDQANQLLDQAGWIMDPNLNLRRKENQLLSFRMSYVDTPDRARVAETIRQDLLLIGVEVTLDPRSLDDLFAQVVSPKLFDTLLYGMNTFIDPDRYELFHSNQSLNLASYVGSEETVAIEGRETVRIPRVDRLLDRARSFDPAAAKSQRLEDYFRFQELLAQDAPVVFLYHPQFLYYVNTRVTNLSLVGAGSLEQRFVNIADWSITQ